jgi:hypothetical protein
MSNHIVEGKKGRGSDADRRTFQLGVCLLAIIPQRACWERHWSRLEIVRETCENGDGGENHENMNGGNERNPRKDTSTGAKFRKNKNEVRIRNAFSSNYSTSRCLTSDQNDRE